MNHNDSPLTLIRSNANEILDSPEDFDSLIEAIGDSHFVLLGEATHGTHEFYRTRAQITIRLIEEKGFSAVAVEADWPDAYRVNRYVRSLGDDSDPMSALNDFMRFPRWMWRNTDVADFISVLKYYNENKPQEKMVGFYGLDLYSLYASINAVIGFLDEVDPDAAIEARKRYNCFEQYGLNAKNFGLPLRYVAKDCLSQAVNQLEDLRKKGLEYVKKGGFALREDLFYAEQNARVACDAEVYYKAMFSDHVSSWNLRDKYMADTMESLAGHLRRYRDPKIVVWAHNCHLGDARATDVSRHGMLNVGQLIRERFNEDAFLVGLFTHSGTVAAASDWGGQLGKKNIPPSLTESYEHLFHRSEIPSFYLILRNNEQLSFLEREHLQRAIGIIYKPENERESHYFSASLNKQFDAIIHFDRTIAVSPLDRNAGWEEGEPLPDTYGSGL